MSRQVSPIPGDVAQMPTRADGALPGGIWVFIAVVLAESLVRAIAAVQGVVSGELRPGLVIMGVAALFCWAALRGMGWALWTYVTVSLLVWFGNDSGQMHLAVDGSVLSGTVARPPALAIAALALLRPGVREWLDAAAQRRASTWRRLTHRIM